MHAIELIVKGNVQRVGYRNFVSQTAFEVEVNGFVENLEDESVKIVVQGSKEKLEKFIERIKVTEWPIVVKSIAKRKIITENTFTEFKIARGEPQKEMLERADEAVLILSKMNSDLSSKITSLDTSLCGKMDQNLEETKKLRKETRAGRQENNRNFSRLNGTIGGFKEDTKQSFVRLDKNIGGLRKDTRESFVRLDKKYGSVSKTLKRIDGNIVGGFKQLNKNTTNKFGELNKNINKGFNQLNKNIVDQFKQLNNNLVTIVKAFLSKS